MPDVVIIQENLSQELTILAVPAAVESDLVYTKGGGTIWPQLVNDFVENGYQWHKGNPVISDQLLLKSYDNTRIINETLKTYSGTITKGLFTLDTTSIVDSETFAWDEVYTSPLGQYEAILNATPMTSYAFKFTADESEELYIATHDMNIIPKDGDYIFIQKARDLIENTYYTDGFNNFPVITNTESYQFKILNTSISVIDGANTIYKLILDKSFKPIIGAQYNIVLLNRENTGIQKELFLDTFEQIEVHRDQLLGDPYNNTSNSTVPSGRKNYLNYKSAQYLGLKTLQNGIINSTLTPFLVFDINNEIRDKFKVEAESFSFLLPFVMFQQDTRVAPNIDVVNKLVNKGTIYSSSNVGQYSGLYFLWDTELQYRVGWLFYDLRIVVIDDSELATAMSYNSNRNYTLPAPVPSMGNTLKNPGGGVDIEISDVSNTTPITITTAVPHNLSEGTGIFITDVYVLDGGGAIISSNANGFKYIKLVYPNGPSQPADPNKFTLWDATLTVPVIGNGTFVRNPSDSSGKVLGTIPEYSYFMTYRLRGKHHSSVAPYSQTISFNFTKDGKVDDSNDAQLRFRIEPLKFLQDNTVTIGYEATDLEIIIGKYTNDNPVAPNLVTGFENAVVLPISELTYPTNLFSLGNQASLASIVVTKEDYENFVALIGGVGPYDKVSNPTGDPTFDIVSNYSHYVYVGGTIPETIVTGEGKWTLGNLTYQQEVEKYRTTIEVVVPAGAWNDTTNPTYNPENPFIKDRYISEIGLVVTEDGIEKPMIYAKVSPAVKKTNILDIILSMSIDF